MHSKLHINPLWNEIPLPSYILNLQSHHVKIFTQLRKDNCIYFYDKLQINKNSKGAQNHDSFF